MRARALFPPLSVSQQVAWPFAPRLRCNYLQDTVSFSELLAEHGRVALACDARYLICLPLHYPLSLN